MVQFSNFANLGYSTLDFNDRVFDNLDMEADVNCVIALDLNLRSPIRIAMNNMIILHLVSSHFLKLIFRPLPHGYHRVPHPFVPEPLTIHYAVISRIHKNIIQEAPKHASTERGDDGYLHSDISAYLPSKPLLTTLTQK